MVSELLEGYIPKEIPHREEQLAKIRNVFEAFKRVKIGNNLIIFGVTGSGKSTIVKKIMEEHPNQEHVYASCENTFTSYRTLRALFNINEKDKSVLLDRIIENLKKNPKVIIIDEVDKIKRGDEFAMLMSHLNTIYRATSVPIILMCIKRDIVDLMPSDAAKTLLFEKVSCPAYSVFELKDILKARLKEANIEVEEGTIGCIAAYAGTQGSARIALNLAMKCVSNDDFSHDFVTDTFKNFLKRGWLEFLSEINLAEKEFLVSLLKNCSHENEVSSQELGEMLGLSDSRVSQLVNTFEKYGAVTSRHENSGRRNGRKRLIKFPTKEVFEDIKEAVEAD